MGLIIFLAGGALLGWLAAIVLRIEEGRGIMANVAAGSVGAVIGGVIGNRGSVLSGISAISLLVGAVGALVLLGVLALFRNRLDGRDR
ncbi:GlsB/YeaQ/YmgE family stress response membrane protein [Pelagerythrobacter rhizovicinus]|uniref:GlsB/YeaQ/YmgE family stress response membrane protein n=1 Tax=Pelagerythrobacter rhizovicinus TaxID=2268576 RepID=A0A4Q2KN12_9SPHN|nr:GlsB/YeaQ/YmgE family stress response membrane protein [Pelagerythrobacter rhizovicinus]RXZ64551.1 GlsB/YeaQ/YmgE family stress response membrane protein [Pelagerythrobacter rhizovicinus]